MKGKLRAKLTYANVMVTILAFIVLGGSAAFAAGQLAKNSVGAPQLKRNSVNTAKVKKGAITGAKIKLSSLGAVPNANKLGGLSPDAFQRGSMWALVSPDGSKLLAQSGGISVQDTTGVGGYWMHFPAKVAGKAIIATAWEGSEGLDPSISVGACGFVNVNTTPDSIGCVKGTNTLSDAFVGIQQNGVGKNTGFYIVVLP
jgi:hypothetical protein